MKKNITLLALFAFCLNCIGQNKIIQNDDIQFEFDDSNWHKQDPQQVLNIQKESAKNSRRIIGAGLSLVGQNKIKKKVYHLGR